MWRSVVLCTSLLLAATVAADDTVERDSATRVGEAKEQAAGERDTKHERKAEQEQAAANAESKQKGKVDEDVEMSGMSILGNDEAPKSLVIVPWKTSQLGDMPGLSKLLDDATQPVDKDVFMRELAYYEIRTNSK
jgi:hypothetical protein